MRKLHVVACGQMWLVRERREQARCRVHRLPLEARSLSTGSFLIYEHDFLLLFPQYQQVVNGKESPSSRFTIGFLPENCCSAASANLPPGFILYVPVGRTSAHPVLDHRCAFRNINEKRWGCVFVSWSLRVSQGRRKDNVCLHVPARAWIHFCLSIWVTLLCWAAPVPWRRQGLTPPAAVSSRRLVCEVALVRWLMMLA